MFQLSCTQARMLYSMNWDMGGDTPLVALHKIAYNY